MRLGVSSLRVAFLAISIILTVHPMHFRYVFTSVQSMTATPHVVAYSLLFLSWSVLLFVLLFRPSTTSWERLVLIAALILVYWGRWAVVSHAEYLRQDGTIHTGTTRLILELGRVDPKVASQVPYQYPAMHLVLGSLSLATGLSASGAGSTLVLANIIAYGLALFLVSNSRFRGYESGQTLFPLILIIGNPWLQNLPSLHPSNYGVTLATFCVGVLYHFIARGTLSAAPMIILSVLIAALAVGHLVSSFTVAFMVAAIVLLLSKVHGSATGRTLLPLAVVAFVSWLLYFSYQYLVGLLHNVSLAIGSNPLDVFLFQWRRGITGAVTLPLWVRALTLFWLFVMVAPVVLVVRQLAHIRALGRVKLIETGGLLGTFVLPLTATGGSILTSVGLIRFLAYVPLFTIPLLLDSLARRKSLLFASAIGLVLLSVPTQYAFNRNAAIHRYYPTDVVVGGFLEATYPGGKGLALFSGSEAGLLHNLYMASWFQEADEDLLVNAQGYWRDLSRLVREYPITPEPKAFVVSPRLIVPYESVFGVTADASSWHVAIGELSRNSKIYDNGDAVVFL